MNLTQNMKNVQQRVSRWNVVKADSGDVRLILSDVDGTGAFISLSPEAAIQIANALIRRANDV